MHLQMTVTIQYEPVTSLAGNNNARLHITNSHVGSIKYHMHYPIFMVIRGCSCNLFDVISVYSLNPGKLPGRFSYKRPGYEANRLSDKQSEPKSYLTPNNPQNICEDGHYNHRCSVVTISARSCFVIACC